MRIYLNNAATSFPKPPEVAAAVARFITDGGANYSRGAASASDLDAMGSVLDAREAVCSLFGGADASLVTFTGNITHSLNVVIKGFVRPGMRVLSTSMEHNAVVRPLRELEMRGAEVLFMPCSSAGCLGPADIRGALASSRWDMVILSCASNVCGAIQDIASIAEECARARVPLVLDTAQLAGRGRIDMRELGAAAICFTGHKGLLGPQGIGGIVWDAEFAARCSTLIEGGTGSFSHEDIHPAAMPDKFEAGTPNMPGIVGLLAGLRYIDRVGMDVLARREDEIGGVLLDGLRQIRGVAIHGPGDGDRRVPVFSISIDGIDCARAADELSSRYGVEGRPGLHCAPLAHRTLGTFPAGSLRLSPGPFTARYEIDAALAAVKEIAERAGRG